MQHIPVVASVCLVLNLCAIPQVIPQVALDVPQYDLRSFRMSAFAVALKYRL